MQNTKLRIDLSQGIVEAEGNEAFVQVVYNDFKELLITRSLETQAQPSIGKTISTSSEETPEK